MGATFCCHCRWDVEKVAESSNFVALTKPAGMFVVTDERGLWEESSTNFIHVAHRRHNAIFANSQIMNMQEIFVHEPVSGARLLLHCCFTHPHGAAMQGGNAHAFRTPTAWYLPSTGLSHERCANLWEVLGCLQTFCGTKRPLDAFDFI